MKKLKMIPNQKLTFEEGCNKYLEYCRQRNTLVSILIKIPRKTHKKQGFYLASQVKKPQVNLLEAFYYCAILLFNYNNVYVFR